MALTQESGLRLPGSSTSLRSTRHVTCLSHNRSPLPKSSFLEEPCRVCHLAPCSAATLSSPIRSLMPERSGSDTILWSARVDGWDSEAEGRMKVTYSDSRCPVTHTPKCKPTSQADYEIEGFYNL